MISKFKFLGKFASLLCAGLIALNTMNVHAHDFSAGALVIDHPYATPSIKGAANGAVYFRSIENKGKELDRLIGAKTTVAETVELHEMKVEQDVARMRELTAIDLPSGEKVQFRHGGGYHLMLMNLKQPLIVGERFDLTLKFEKAGEKTVKVWVQQPRNMGNEHHKH